MHAKMVFKKRVQNQLSLVKIEFKNRVQHQLSLFKMKFKTNWSCSKSISKSSSQPICNGGSLYLAPSKIDKNVFLFWPTNPRGQPKVVEPFDLCAHWAHRSNETRAFDRCAQWAHRSNENGEKKFAANRPRHGHKKNRFAIFFVASYFSSRSHRTRVANCPHGQPPWE